MPRRAVQVDRFVSAPADRKRVVLQVIESACHHLALSLFRCNDPDIFEAVDLFDSQFGDTDSGPTLYDEYGPAASFLTVLNQNGQTTSLPSTDPSGAGTDNWELEE